MTVVQGTGGASVLMSDRDRFRRIDEARGRSGGPEAATQPQAVPGYRYGFSLSLNVVTGVASVSPGVASIRGQLVRCRTA